MLKQPEFIGTFKSSCGDGVGKNASSRKVSGIYRENTGVFDDDDFDELIGDRDEGVINPVLVAPGREFQCHENNLRFINDKTHSLRQSGQQYSFHPMNRRVESLQE